MVRVRSGSDGEGNRGLAKHASPPLDRFSGVQSAKCLCARATLKPPVRTPLPQTRAQN